MEIGIRRERAIRSAEVPRVRLERELVALQLEQVRAEQNLYSAASPHIARLTRKPLEGLLPVRRGRAVLEQKEAKLRLSAQRLLAVEGRRQEIRTRERLHEKLLQDRTLLQYRLARTVIRAPVAGAVPDWRPGPASRRSGPGGRGPARIGRVERMAGRNRGPGSRPAKVREGQKVKLYIDAFPHMEYKVFFGGVNGVSIEPMAGGSGYLVVVAIADPEVGNAGKMYSLAYDMSVNARIVVDRGRIAALFWSRIMRSLGHITQHDFHLNTELPRPFRGYRPVADPASAPKMRCREKEGFGSRETPPALLRAESVRPKSLQKEDDKTGGFLTAVVRLIIKWVVAYNCLIHKRSIPKPRGDFTWKIGGCPSPSRHCPYFACWFSWLLHTRVKPPRPY